MPKKEAFTSIFGETRGGRVPPKSKIWGDLLWMVPRGISNCSAFQLPWTTGLDKIRF